MFLLSAIGMSCDSTTSSMRTSAMSPGYASRLRSSSVATRFMRMSLTRDPRDDSKENFWPGDQSNGNEASLTISKSNTGAAGSSIAASKIDDDLSKYKSIGIGPGIGTASETKTMLQELMENYKMPVVLDADALNCIAAQKEMLKIIPAGSVLTPHPKEFERLFGKTSNEFERIELALQKSNEFNIIIVLKGHHTFIATPANKGFFNSTGNAGMATGGGGDVLTGILAGLSAQGYSSVDTAILGVYIHGLAGDIAAEKCSMEAMIAGDLIENLKKHTG